MSLATSGDRHGHQWRRHGSFANLVNSRLRPQPIGVTDGPSTTSCAAGSVFTKFAHEPTSRWPLTNPAGREWLTRLSSIAPLAYSAGAALLRSAVQANGDPHANLVPGP